MAPAASPALVRLWGGIYAAALNHLMQDSVELTCRPQIESFFIDLLIDSFHCVALPATGPLCAGMGGKKKKKMMYLTTKNAGRRLAPS